MAPSRVYKSAERIEDTSSSDDEDQQARVRDLLARSPSPASPEIRSSSLALSASRSPSASPGSRSPTRSPSPERVSSYIYTPPSSHELSSSKAKSILPSLRSHHQVFRLRIPAGVSLDQVKFNFQRRRVRIGDEEWTLMEESIGGVRIIEPIEDSEEFGFAKFPIEKGWSLARDVTLPTTNWLSRPPESIEPNSPTEPSSKYEKKRKHEKVAEADDQNRKKHGEKSHKHRKKDKDEHREKRKEEKHSHKSDKEKKHKSKRSHSHS